MTDPSNQKMEQTNCNDATGFQTIVHGGTVSVGPHYHSAALPKPGYVDFERYLQFIRQDSRYQTARDLYTETEALIPLEAETVEQKLERSEQDIEQAQRKIERFPVLEGLRKYALGREQQHVLLAGRPGSGKSTTLKRLLLELADAGLSESAIIPVYVQLKSDRAITDLILAEFRKAKVRVTPVQLDDLLLQDQLLLLLDGVNEMPSDERRRHLQDFREDNPTTPMIFTTRDLSIGGDLGIDKRLEMRPLSEPQMRQFVGKYLAKRGMPDQADTLLRQLHDRLREIAKTPLLLKMLCDVFDPASQQIPRSKGELFRQFDRDYKHIKKDSQLIPVSENFWEFIADILQFLAFSMIRTNDPKSVEAWYVLPRERVERLLETWLSSRGISDPATKAKLWLKDLRRCHLLQDAKDPGTIEFHHQLFQEYYAAEYLLRLLIPPNGEPGLTNEQLTHEYLNLLKWTESVALMLELVDEEEQALRLVKLARDIDLMLGARFAGEVKPSFQEKTVQLITGSSKFSWNLKVELLSKTHSEAAIPTLKKMLEEEDACSYSTNRGFLDGSFKICGFFQEKKEVLTNRRAHKSPLVKKLKVARALVNTSSKKAITLLLKINIISLGDLGNLSVLPVLIELSQTNHNTDTRRDATIALLKLDRNIGHVALFDLLEDYDNDLFDGLEHSFYWQKCSDAIEELKIESFLPRLLFLLKSPNYWARFNAAQILAKFNKKEAIPVLISFINDSDSGEYRWNFSKKRRRILSILAKLGSEAIIPELVREIKESIHPKATQKLVIDSFMDDVFSSVPPRARLLNRKDKNEKKITKSYLLEDPKSDPGLEAALILVRLKSHKAITALLELLEDENFEVRIRAVLALGWLGDSTSVRALSQALNDSQDKVIKAAASSLARIGTNDAVQELKKSIESGLKMTDIHRACLVISSLSNLDPMRAVPILETFFLDALEHQEVKVKDYDACIIYTLSKFKSEEAIPLLQKAIKSQDPRIRTFAAFGLGNLGCEEAFSELLTTLKDRDWSLREIAIKVLVELTSQVKNEKIIPALVKAVKDSKKNKKSSLYKDSVRALGLLGNNKAKRALKNIQNQESLPLRRIQFSEAIGDLDSEVSTKILVEELKKGFKNQKDLYAGTYYTVTGIDRCRNALKEFGSSIAIFELWQIQKTVDNSNLLSTIEAIQNRCQFYNREIWQESIQHAKIEIPNEDQAVASQTTYIFSNATEPKIFERVEHYYSRFA